MRTKQGEKSRVPNATALIDLNLPSGEVYRALGTTLRLLAHRLESFLDEDPPDPLNEQLGRVRDLTNDLVQKLGTIADQEPRTRDRPSLVTALRRLGSDFTRATGTSVDVRVTGRADLIAPDVVDILFIVACEVFLSIERHGRATIVLLTLSVDESNVLLEIRDDGIDVAQRESYDFQAAIRQGLVAVSEMVKTVGGRAAMTTTTPRGLRLVVEVPRHSGRHA